MEHFSKFPKVSYMGKDVTDITVRLNFIQKIKDNVSLFQHYNIQNNEKPEDVAYKLYGDPALYWVILYINDIIDPYYDWLLSDKRLYEYVVNKYGVENVSEIHHTETTAAHDLGAGTIVNASEQFSIPVSNLTYEDTLNESKRKIKILRREYLQQVLSEYSKELSRI